MYINLTLSVGFAATSPKGRGFFIIPIITQIGRENKFSAEVFVSANSPLRMQREEKSFLLLFLSEGCEHFENVILVILKPERKLDHRNCVARDVDILCVIENDLHYR